MIFRKHSVVFSKNIIYSMILLSCVLISDGFNQAFSFEADIHQINGDTALQETAGPDYKGLAGSDDERLQFTQTTSDDLFKELDAEIKGSSGDKKDDDLFKELDSEIKGSSGGKSDDLFKELDKLTENSGAGKKGRGSVFLKELGDNFEGALIPRMMYHLTNFKTNEENRDKRKLFVDYRLEFNTETSLSDLRLKIGGWFEGGNQRVTYNGITRFMRDVDDSRRYFEIDELTISRSWDKFDITIGQKSFDLGLSTLYTPTDRIEPVDLNDSINTKRLGSWQCTLDYFISETTITFAALPFFQPDKLPHESSRWAGKGGEVEFSGIIPGTEIGESYPPNRYVQGLLRGKTTYKGWDLFLAAFHGYSKFPVLKATPFTIGPITLYEYEKDYPKVFNTSTGFSTTYKKFEFHGEGVYQYTYKSRDDNYLDYSLGFTYTIDDLAKNIHHDRIEITIEYGGEWLDKLQGNPNYEQSSATSRRIHNNILCRLHFKYNEDFKWNYGINYELPQDSWFQAVAIEYDIRSDLTLKAGLEFFDGKEETSFERWEDNDRLVIQLEYKF